MDANFSPYLVGCVLTPLQWAELIHNMRVLLHQGPKQFTQVPQLSTGRDEDLTQLRVQIA